MMQTQTQPKAPPPAHLPAHSAYPAAHAPAYPFPQPPAVAVPPSFPAAAAPPSGIALPGRGFPLSPALPPYVLPPHSPAGPAPLPGYTAGGGGYTGEGASYTGGGPTYSGVAADAPPPPRWVFRSQLWHRKPRIADALWSTRCRGFLPTRDPPPTLPHPYTVRSPRQREA
jgi:hypothetical protein